jgi:hypothetical protein
MSNSRKPNTLPSSAEGRLQQLYGDLVLQLFMRRGPFWEVVAEVRDRWNITAKVQLPPSVRGLLLLPNSAPDINEDDRAKGTEKYKKYEEYVSEWDTEMSRIRLKAIPELTLFSYDFFSSQLKESLHKFFAACTLYDPPEDQLIEFACYAKLEPIYLPDPLVLDRGYPDGRPEMIYPPIKSLSALQEAGDWYWQRVLDYIGKRYLEPQGVNIQDLLETALWEIPGLYEGNREKARQYSNRFYIEVDEHISQEDVKNAFRMIRAIQRSKGTKPRRYRLIAVQCAILYDRYNPVDPEDKRRRTWTYETLADHFGLSSSRAAKDHVTLGREILEGKDLDER